MTREEAKNTICIFHEQILKDLWLTRDARNGLGEALDMAIEALKEQRPQGEWIPVSERLPEEKINPNTRDFEVVLCTTTWGDVRPYKYGKPIGHDKAHFWHGYGIMDKEVISWMPLPEPYQKEGEAE